MNDVLNFTLIYAHLNLGNNKAASSEFNSNSGFAKLPLSVQNHFTIFQEAN